MSASGGKRSLAQPPGELRVASRIQRAGPIPSGASRHGVLRAPTRVHASVSSFADLVSKCRASSCGRGELGFQGRASSCDSERLGLELEDGALAATLSIPTGGVPPNLRVTGGLEARSGTWVLRNRLPKQGVAEQGPPSRVALTGRQRHGRRPRRGSSARRGVPEVVVTRRPSQPRKRGAVVGLSRLVPTSPRCPRTVIASEVARANSEGADLGWSARERAAPGRKRTKSVDATARPGLAEVERVRPTE